MPSRHSTAATTIGERVRTARTQQGATMEELAQTAQIDVSNLGRIERGIILPRVDSLVRIATALGMDAGHFVQGIDADDLPSSTPVYRVQDFIDERERRLATRTTER